MLICTLVCQVVPMENMNGRELVEAGDLCERRNGLTVYPSDFKYSTLVHDYLQRCLNTYASVLWQVEESISIEIGV